VGACVELHVHLDEQGRMLSAEVSRSRGHEAFERSALQVARAMRFSPALNRDCRVSVWVSVPLVFEAR
jgi:TonB family protein